MALFNHLFYLVIITLVNPSLQNINNNEIDNEDVSPFAEAAASILKEQNAQNLGAMVNNLMASDGAKQLMGDVLSNVGGPAKMLQGLGALMGGQGGAGLDPALLGSMLSLLNTQTQKGEGKEGEDEAYNVNDLLSLAGNFLGQPGHLEALTNFLPMIQQNLDAFIGSDASKREMEHADHKWLPPNLERFHVQLDHFLHSEMGKSLINTLGAEKTIKVFKDEDGKFSYRKFVQMLENHSFRKHWISMVTDRIASALSYVADPKIQRKYLTSFQYFFNSFFKTQGFPKSAMFDPGKPTESVTGFINHGLKKYFGFQVSSKQYVKPAVEYVQDIQRLIHKNGLVLNSDDSRELSNKLADTINLEVIEPLARVNRAYRFSKAHPVCDRYVFCLVNQDNPNERLSLPGLKLLLSRSSSLMATWFLSGHTGTPFWTLYTDIIGATKCKPLYQTQCNDFHIEEEKVTTEYVHNEL